MKIPALLLLCCPECHAEFDFQVEETFDEQIVDKFAPQKCQSFRQRLGDENLLQIIDKMGLKRPETEQEWQDTLLNHEIVSGKLICRGCRHEFAIKHRIAVFVE